LRIIKHRAELRQILDAARCQGKTVGMMGTSGALHDGHLSLVRGAVKENDVSAMFYGGSGGGPRLYDRDEKRDLALCEEAGMQIAYVPAPGDYMTGRESTVLSQPVLFGGDQQGMENPAHLHQITLAMAVLYNIFGPCKMYSGEKDWQQLAIFTRLAEDLRFPVEVVPCPTVRDADGLALSSRNVKLTPEQRAQAPLIYKALKQAAAAIAAGERSLAKVKAMVAEHVAPLGEIDYLVSVDPKEVTPNDPMTGDVRLMISVKVGEIRLLDNIGARAG
jgi:pantoate--beta-alanine ligase